MDINSLVETLGDNQSLKHLARSLQPPVNELLDSSPLVKEFLRGNKWLGHPLHPVLTDITIGAYTGAFFLDITGRREMERASDYLLTLGVLSALGTAAAGTADWSATKGPARQVGMFHALTNTAALALYVASLAARRAGKRSNGVRLSLIAYGVANAAAYFGGHLVYKDGIGVDGKASAGKNQRAPIDPTTTAGSTGLSYH